MGRSQPRRKTEEAGLEESILGRNNSLSKGLGAGKASSSSVLSWEGWETSGKE